MDSITQALVGVAASQLSVRKKLREKEIWLIGIAAGTAPDLDVLIRSSNHPLWRIEFHRHFTHSLFFIPIGALIVTLVLLLLFKNLRSKWQVVALGVLAAYATHGLLDCCTSYGTVFFWPISNTRISLDIIAIVDTIFTGALLIGTVSTSVFDNIKPLCYSLCFCACYLILGFYQHHRAITSMILAAHQRGIQIKRLRAMPIVNGALTIWKGALLSQQANILIYQTKTNPFVSSKSFYKGQYPQFQDSDLNLEIKENPTLWHDYSVFKWFCDGYMTKASQQPLILADLRYVYGNQPQFSMWGIVIDSHKHPSIAWQRHIILTSN